MLSWVTSKVDGPHELKLTNRVCGRSFEPMFTAMDDSGRSFELNWTQTVHSKLYVPKWRGKVGEERFQNAVKYTETDN